MFLSHKTPIAIRRMRPAPTRSRHPTAALLLCSVLTAGMASCSSVSKHPVDPPQRTSIEAGSVIWLINDTARTRNIGSKYYAIFSIQRYPDASEVLVLEVDEDCKIIEDRTIQYLIGTEDGEKLYLITLDDRPELGVVAAMQMIITKEDSMD